MDKIAAAIRVKERKYPSPFPVKNIHPPLRTKTVIKFIFIIYIVIITQTSTSDKLELCGHCNSPSVHLLNF